MRVLLGPGDMTWAREEGGPSWDPAHDPFCLHPSLLRIRFRDAEETSRVRRGQPSQFPARLSSRGCPPRTS